jgi:hypothetical protein
MPSGHETIMIEDNGCYQVKWEFTDSDRLLFEAVP